MNTLSPDKIEKKIVVFFCNYLKRAVNYYTYVHFLTAQNYVFRTITTSSLALIVFHNIKLVLFINSLNSSPLKIAQAERIKNTARDLLSGLVNNKDMCDEHPN